MNRLLLPFFICGAALIIFLAQRNSLAATRENLAQLSSRADAARNAAEAVQKSVAATRADWESERERTKFLQSDVKEVVAAPGNPLADFPAQEISERWPMDQKWFYLAKKELPKIGFALFRPDGNLSDEAALLFGLSASERAEVEAAFGKMMRSLIEAELASIQPAAVDVRDDKNFPKIEKQAFKIPALTESETFREQFHAAMAGILGAQRAELFLQQADVYLRRSLEDLGKGPRTIEVMRKINSAPLQWDVIKVGGASGSVYCYRNDRTEPKREMNFKHYSDLIRTYLQQGGK